MKRMMVKEIFNAGKSDYETTVKGWIRSVRNSKAFSFIVLNDGSCQDSLQIVVDEKISNYQEVTGLLTGTSVEIQGKIVPSGGKGQSVEMQASRVLVIGLADATFPLQKKGTSLEFLREIAHLRPRTNTFGAVFRLRHVLAKATHDFFDSKGFVYLNSPIITAIDGEGAGEMFKVSTMNFEKLPKLPNGQTDYSKDYFARETSLCVTGQLEGECFASALGSIYTFGPTFRSENSNTPRHLAEFWMIEPEVAFADLEDVAALAIDYIKFMVKAAFDKCPEDLAFLHKMYEPTKTESLQKFLSSEAKKITYTEAIDLLNKSGKKFEFPTHWGSEIQTEHERYLAEELFDGPVIVTDYPKHFKAFYMKQNPDGKTVRAMDILVPGVGELIGGSQREDNYEKLINRMTELKMKVEDYWWYTDLRKFGSVPHAGFGLGFERAIMYISGMKNIRDVIPFPRFPKNADF
jgi:asparaginyl-tRNA synthetase